jgi:hypothetical protein
MDNERSSYSPGRQDKNLRCTLTTSSNSYLLWKVKSILDDQKVANHPQFERKANPIPHIFAIGHYGRDWKLTGA